VIDKLALAYHSDESSFVRSGKASRSSGAALSHAVIEPLLPFVSGDRILFAPDGALHYVPLAALPLPASAAQSRAHLIDKFEISEFGSLAQLATVERSSGRKAWKRELLLVADPVYSATESLPPLPGTALEAKAILALFPGKDALALSGVEANRNRVLSELATGARVIHVAAHAFVDTADPRLSYVALSNVDREGGAINGNLLAGELANSNVNAELVTLSGCETHVGAHMFGDGLRGLSHAWIQAGARTAIGSLWRVSDNTTEVLMRHFYSQLEQEGMRPALALRIAQLAVLQGERHWKPYHWASFVPITTTID
jgi:CHAT domain-containing protein